MKVIYMYKINHIKQFAKKFAAQETGSILLFFALGVFFLVGIAGAGLDLGRNQLKTIKYQEAADAAAVSAASLTNPGGVAISDAERLSAGRRYFSLNNYTSQDGLASRNSSASQAFLETIPSVTLSNGSITVKTDQADTTTDTETNFVKIFGISTLKSQGSSVVTIPQTYSPDYDVVVVASEGYMVKGIQAEKTALNTMADAILPNNNCANPNVRLGFISYGMKIDGKWGLTCYNSAIKQAINSITDNSVDFTHTAMMAAADMMDGGHATEHDGVTPEAKAYYPPLGTKDVDGNPVGSNYQNMAIYNPLMPLPASARTHTSDAKGLSSAKYVIFIASSFPMMAPTDYDGYAQWSAFAKSGWHYADIDKTANQFRTVYDYNHDTFGTYKDQSGLVHKNCKNRVFEYTTSDITAKWSNPTNFDIFGNYPANYQPPKSTVQPCYQALTEACTNLKNTGGTDNVHVITIKLDADSQKFYGSTVPLAQDIGAQTLKDCASTALPNSRSFSSAIKPYPTQDFYVAPDQATLSTILTNVTTQIQSVRITN